MTDTRHFYTIAIDRTTGRWRKFWHVFPTYHNRAAKQWLAEIAARKGKPKTHGG